MKKKKQWMTSYFIYENKKERRKQIDNGREEVGVQKEERRV